MTSRIDLHLHTTCSDGELTPREVVEAAGGLGLRTVAITDHDSLAGVGEGLVAARDFQLDLIPGVEISCELAEGEAHVLGYFVSTDDDTPLATKLARFRAGRLDRARRILDKLAHLGMRLQWEEVESLAHGESVGRPHIAQALLNRGYVDSVSEAFDRYLGREGPAYVSRYKVTPEDAIHLIHDAGGVAALAHPRDVVDLVGWLAAEGLDGLEVYYPSYSAGDSAQLVEIARRYGLIVTGGTDFHGPNVTPGVGIGSVEVPERVVEELYARHSQLAGG